MDKKLKRRWLRALRSGKYKQGTNRLRTVGEDGEDRFCCLGVLCDIAVKDAHLTWKRRVDRLDWWEFDGGRSYLSLRMTARTGLSAGAQAGLSIMNDDGKRFKTIAAYIEKSL